MHAILHTGCTDTVRVSALSVDWEKHNLPHRRIEPAPVAYRSDALPTELYPHQHSSDWNNQCDPWQKKKKAWVTADILDQSSKTRDL